jgi:S-adenosylmethionine hydrolase
LQVKFPKEREKMPIVTLTSDFGEKDWYAAALKGAILKTAPAVQLVSTQKRLDGVSGWNCASIGCELCV